MCVCLCKKKEDKLKMKLHSIRTNAIYPGLTETVIKGFDLLSSSNSISMMMMMFMKRVADVLFHHRQQQQLSLSIHDSRKKCAKVRNIVMVDQNHQQHRSNDANAYAIVYLVENLFSSLLLSSSSIANTRRAKIS